MTQVVTLDNGDTIEFPDGMSPDAMASAIKQHLNPPSTLGDVAKSAAYAPAKAAIGFAGLPGDVRDLVAAGKRKLSSYLPDSINQADALAARFNPFTYLSGALPTSGQLRGAVEQVTGPFYDPQTRAGKIADTAVEAATTLGRNAVQAPLRSLLQVGGITAGTEGAGALTGDNAYARLGGGLLGGGIPALFNAMKTKPGAIIKESLGDLTPQQINAAIATQDSARALGIPLLGTESLDRGHQLASAVLAHPSGNQTVENFLRARPQQVEQAVQSGLLAQTGPRATPEANAARAEQAATQYIGDAERARTQAVSPYYQAAAAQQVPSGALFNAYMSAQRALGGYPAALFPAENRALSSLAAKLTAPEAANAGFLDKLYQQARNDAQPPAIGATPEQKNVAAAFGPVVSALGAASGANPSIARGRGLYQAITDTTIDPLRAGPIGRIAGQTGKDAAEPSSVGRVVSTVADANVARPETIRDMYQRLNGTDPRAFPGIVQTHIENQLNAALADVRSGANPTAGAKFRQALVGTPQDAANFDEMMRGVAQANGANPAAVVQGAHNLLDVLERTGRTPGVGSQTAGRGEINREMGKTIVGDTLSTISLNPFRPLARRLDEFVQRGRYVDVARALTAPDSVQQLVQLAKYQPNTLTASYVVASMLGLDKAIAGGQ